MKAWFAKFMEGRYGGDDYGRFLSVIAIVLIVLSVVFSSFVSWLSTALWIIGFALIIYCYYRMFSRDTTRRSAENQKYLNNRYQRAVLKQQRKERNAQKADFKFYKCPKCGVLNRIPKGKGKIEITCPKCGEKFIRKS